MKLFLRLLVVLIVLGASSGISLWYAHDHRIHDRQNFDAKVLALANRLPLSGTLRIDKNGKYVYLKIDDKYVSELAPILEPLGYIPLHNSRGAHITVFDKNELKKLSKTIPEIGDTFNFNINGLARFSKNTKKVNKYFFVIKIDSNELTDLRTKYGLKTRKKGFFHITIAEQKPDKER